MNKISNDIRLAEIFNRYDMSENHSVFNDLLVIEEKISCPDIIIPVIGTQGAGKSTLINSIIGEDILPNEADETTCIPVEIRYGEEKVEVYHKNGNKEIIEKKKNKLAKYVDNAYNPGNEKKVSHICVSNEYNALKNGVIIVDLPGVGSLTIENEETTKKYIEKLSAAIFVISTSPPIKESEAKFIKNIWRGINKIFFVQNVWDDNSDDEIKEGKDFNSKALKIISNEIGVDFSDGIISVNAYKAAKGAFDKNEKMIEESNVLGLFDVISVFADKYSKILYEDYEKRVKKAIESIIINICKIKQQKKMSKEELLNTLKREREQFQKATDEIYDNMSSLDELILSLKVKARHFARDISVKKSELLRVDMDRIIDGGVVDGNNLSQAFSDNQLLYGSEACDEAYNELQKYNEEIQQYVDELINLLEKEKMDNSEEDNFYRKKELKWENIVKGGFDIGGAIGGSIIASIVTGAVEGSWGGPAGVVVGILVAITVSLIGSGIKKAKMNQRAKEAKEQIKPYITKFRNNLYEIIDDSFSKYFDSIMDVLVKFRKNRQDYLDALNNRILDIMKNGNDIDLEIEELDSDLDYLKNWR